MATAPVGECTWYCLQRRPDIAKSSLAANAYGWASGWRSLGNPISSVPHVGDVACFQPGAQGAGGTGHVAYVESIQSDGSFTVSEMNCAGCGTPPGAFNKVDTRSGLKPGFGVTFLGPAAGYSPAPGAGTSSLTTTTAGVQAAPVGASLFSVLGDLTGISGIVGALINGGEVVLGALLGLAGLYMFAKDTAPGQAVGKVTGAAADIIPAGRVGKAVRAARRPVQAAKKAQVTNARRAEANERDSERNARDANRREIAANNRRRAVKPRSVPGYSTAQRKSAKKRYQTGDKIGTATVSKVGKTRPDEVPF